jgi:hypothetical protein
VRTQPVIHRHRNSALAAVAMGVATTLTVAWAAALFAPFWNLWQGMYGEILKSPSTGESVFWYVTRLTAPAGTRYYSRGLVYTGQEELRPHLPSWTRFTIASSDDPLNHPVEIAEARGWPWRCLAYRIIETDTTFEIRGGFDLERVQFLPSRQRYPSRALPYTPIWSGLLVNTLLYAMMWLLLFAAFIESRRVWRRRRSRCLECGYLLVGHRHERCPECGNEA